MIKYISTLANVISFSQRDLEDLEKNIAQKNLSDFIVIKKFDLERARVFELISNKFPFLFITKEKVRNYDNNQIFSHVLGYVGYKQDVEEEKLNNLKFGISGIEKIFDTTLLGSDGWIKLETNSKGRIKKEINKKLAIPGKNISTNLITDIQEKAFNLLSGISGAAVMMDCETGGVNCMVSTPSFDNNEFSNGVTSERWKQLIEDEKDPLLNRCIAGLYSPGSTYKILTALYALEIIGFDHNKIYSCPGFFEFGNRKFHCWKKNGHGNVNLFDAIKKSCDCYFYNLAKEVDIDSLSRFSKKFSLGMFTGIDIPNEHIGIMPDKKWKLKNRGERWREEKLQYSYRSRFYSIYPLQITLKLAESLQVKYQTKYFKKKKIYFLKICLSLIKFGFIRRSMYSVVNDYDGTANSSKLRNQYKMAGKTGTSQVRRISKEERESGVLKNEELQYKLRDHSIFTCYAPYDKPKFALTVIAEHMGSGSKVAAPIAKNIMELALKKFI